MDRDTVVVARLEAAAPAPSPPRRRSRGRLGRSLSKVGMNLAFLAMLGCAGVMILPAMLGYHRYVILTGSMTGTYDRGTIVFDKPVPVSDLRVGDPITYAPPPGATSHSLVTHRLWRITRGPAGQRVFQTKGDANPVPDVWKFMLNKPTQDRVVFDVPYLGYLFMLLSMRTFRIFMVGIPAVLIGAFLLRRLWIDAGEAARKQKLAEAGWQKVADTGGDGPLDPLEEAATRLAPVRVDLELPPRVWPAPRWRKQRVAHSEGRSRLHVDRLGRPEIRASAQPRRRRAVGHRDDALLKPTRSL
jgi:signal peptidase